MSIGVWISSFSAGAAIGPLLGGVLLERYSWGSVFLLAVPVMALLLVVGPLLLPEYRDPEAGRLDLVSAGPSLAALLLVIWGLKQLARDGMGLPPALSILAGLVVGVVFARRQQTLADPLLDLRLFRSPAFSAALAPMSWISSWRSLPRCLSPRTCSWSWGCHRCRRACGCCPPPWGSSSGPC